MQKHSFMRKTDTDLCALSAHMGPVGTAAVLRLRPQNSYTALAAEVLMTDARTDMKDGRV